MSQYLVFKKGNTELTSFSRNSNLYRAFEHLPFSEEWKELDIEKDFNIAFGNATVQKEGYEDSIALREKALEGLSYEEKLECLNDIKELKEELDEVIRTRHYIDLLQMIAEEYDTDGHQQKMYYCIG